MDPSTSFIPSDALLGRYVAERATPEERHAVEAWAAGDAQRQIFLAEIRQAWNVRPMSLEDADEGSAWDELSTRIRAIPVTDPSRAFASRIPNPAGSPVRRRAATTLGYSLTSKGQGFNNRRVISWAAAIGCMALAIVVGRWYHLVSLPSRAHPTKTYATSVGQLATITLPDGSHVTLAPRTVLQVPTTFGADDRTVSLQGEARFDVEPVRSAPFRVRTGSVVTSVLGTTFSVRRYFDDSLTRVAVASGRVSIAAKGHRATTLAAGMIAEASDSLTTSATVGDVAPYTSWQSGRLDFREARVSEVLATLERWYGVHFQVADPAIERDRVTAVLDFTATTDLVYALETLLNVSATSAATRSGTVITLHPRRAGVRTTPTLKAEPTRRTMSSLPSEVGR